MPEYKYKSYNEIPLHMKDYILTVSNEHDLNKISLEDINNFLNGLEQWQKEENLTAPVRKMNQKSRQD